MENLPRAVREEVERAEVLLQSLVGEKIPTISINSLDPDEAPFLGLITSKLSPMIGNLIERRITAILHDEEAEHGMRWVRQDPGFPDALLVDRDGNPTSAGYEVKAWYALSTELTGRFRESVNLLAPRNVRVVVVGWVMSHLVYGTPTVIGVLSTDALDVAGQRDRHYHRPPDYLCVEPRNTAHRTSNLQQTNVAGYKFQETDSDRVDAARQLAESSPGYGSPSHEASAQEMAEALMNTFAYRLDTNFAKIDRIDHPEIEAFKTRMLAIDFEGRQLSEWVKVLNNLTGDNDRKRKEATSILRTVYNGHQI